MANAFNSITVLYNNVIASTIIIDNSDEIITLLKDFGNIFETIFEGII